MAVTPDEISNAWRDARVDLQLSIHFNGEWFGKPVGSEMGFGFDEIIAHAARTRRLAAGTIIGSRTMSNARGVRGSACIVERRAREQIEQGKPSTAYMPFWRWCTDGDATSR